MRIQLAYAIYEGEQDSLDNGYSEVVWTADFFCLYITQFK